MNEEGVTLAGSMTSVWNIQPEDRVEMDLALLYFDRGNWQPTVFSLKSKDFCKSMYDEKQFWYKVWTGHVTNSKDVKDKCVHPGTKLEIEQYVLSLTTAVPGQLRSGRYRAQLSFNAFPQGETKRPPSICFEVVGDLLKL
ncbi:uncharacterized protein LOC117583114 isoform X2 [Drosophila guanche]|nr:uncharacterized protein LOC117583114 isoform X2 [Drosophila guanche]